MIAKTITTRDGRGLHTERNGSEPVRVVFESGMGGARHSWGLVAPAVAEHVGCVTYDRANLGRSDDDSQPRTLQRMTEDLYDVVDAIASKPVVLVGHSYGGPIIRSFASQHPAKVAGLVLVDQSDETCPLFFDPKGMRNQRSMTRAMVLGARLGITRLVVNAMAKNLPTDKRRAMVREEATVRSARGMQAEMAQFETDFTKLRDEPLTQPNVPTVVISGTKIGRIDKKNRPALIEAHKARAAAHPQGSHVEATKSGHYVPLSEPQLVIDAVLGILKN